MPARIAETSAMLSRDFRPGTDGTVMRGALPESALVAGTTLVESIAMTVTGSRDVPIAAGGVPGCASFEAQAVSRASVLRRRTRKLVMSIEWSVVGKAFSES